MVLLPAGIQHSAHAQNVPTNLLVDNEDERSVDG